MKLQLTVHGRGRGSQYAHETAERAPHSETEIIGGGEPYVGLKVGKLVQYLYREEATTQIPVLTSSQELPAGVELSPGKNQRRESRGASLGVPQAEILFILAIRIPAVWLGAPYHFILK